MTVKRNTGLVILCLCTAVFTYFIWSNSMLDGEESGAMSKSITEFLCGLVGETAERSFDSVHHFIRKAAHFTEFFILGAFYALIKVKLDGKGLSQLVFFPISCTLFTAVTDEFIQSFTGRGSSVRDVMLDFSGALTGIAFVIAVWAIIKKCNGKSRKM